jgi:hypothetical protein
MHTLRSILWGLVLCSAPAAAASINDRTLLDPAAFDAQAEQIRAEFTPNGRYGFLSDRQRQQIEEDLELMARLLAPRRTGQSLPDADLVQLYNAQERVNARLERRDAKRTVCERRRVLGSNIPKVECLSYGEHKRRTRGMDEADKMRFQQCRGADCARERAG